MSKQRERKLITVPKIINITDTLLANNAIVKCSTLALCELAYEFFFKQNTILDSEQHQPTEKFQHNTTAGHLHSSSSTTATTIPGANIPGTISTTAKDINTQKEVAFSMLIKFLDAIEVSVFLRFIYGRFQFWVCEMKTGTLCGANIDLFFCRLDELLIFMINQKDKYFYYWILFSI